MTIRKKQFDKQFDRYKYIQSNFFEEGELVFDQKIIKFPPYFMHSEHYIEFCGDGFP